MKNIVIVDTNFLINNTGNIKEIYVFRHCRNYFPYSSIYSNITCIVT